MSFVTSYSLGWSRSNMRCDLRILGRSVIGSKLKILCSKIGKKMTDKDKYVTFIVPLMLIISSAIMAAAWLGHLKYKENSGCRPLNFIGAAYRSESQ